VARALVTGGAGFVGHGVVSALTARGAHVTVLDPGPPHPDWPIAIKHVRGDVRNRSVVDQAASAADLVFHVAGIWDGGPGGDDRMRSINQGGTANVLGLGLPVVYTSSSITCGFGDHTQPGVEDGPSEDPARPIRGTGRVYRETKLHAEEQVKAAGGWIVNPDYVVGPGDCNGVVTRPLISAARLPVAPIPGGGKCFTGLADVAEGHILAVMQGQPGRRYMLGAENWYYRDIISEVAQLMGRKGHTIGLPDALPRLLRRIPRLGKTAGAIEQMTLVRFRDSSRARTELGWAPRPVKHALREMVTWTTTRASWR